MSSVLGTVATVSVALGVISAGVIVFDLVRGHAQKMPIMNVVWPLTALWAGPLGLAAYYRWGRNAGAKPKQSMAVQVGKGATHCGSGCAAGDICAELLAAILPLSLFGHRMFGAWIYDYVSAFAFGLLFQYLTIKPMRHLSRGEGLKAAFKADALSLSAWQIGMYGWMALATFVIFRHELSKSSPVFWFMMQVGMLLGFLTSYPVNWLLIRRGLKERM